MLANITTTNNQDLVIIENLPMDQNPAAVYLGSLNSKSGERAMRGALNNIANMMLPGANPYIFPWARLRRQHTARIKVLLSRRYESPATINRHLCALRGVLKEAWRLEQMTSEDYYRARDVESVTGETIPAGRAITREEFRLLMETCSNDLKPAGFRDAAIMAIFYSAGPRLAEVIGMDAENIELLENGNYKIKITGKRNRERLLNIRNGAAAALADWLSIRGSEPGPLFNGITKGGKISNKRVTTQAMYNITQKRGEQVGVKDFSPHDLRRTFISDLLDAGADIATVAKMAGHANVQTTARYDRRPEVAKEKAADLLHVPYRRRIPETA